MDRELTSWPRVENLGLPREQYTQPTHAPWAGDACLQLVHFAEDAFRAEAALTAEHVPSLLRFPEPLPFRSIARQLADPLSGIVILTRLGGIE